MPYLYYIIDCPIRISDSKPSVYTNPLRSYHGDAMHNTLAQGNGTPIVGSYTQTTENPITGLRLLAVLLSFLLHLNLLMQ